MRYAFFITRNQLDTILHTNGVQSTLSNISLCPLELQSLDIPYLVPEIPVHSME
jgi:hypothetical protein